jgi:protein-disulfide isomerase
VQAYAMQRAADAPPVAAEMLVREEPIAFVDPAKALGPADAPITIILFGDLWCPACRGVHDSLISYQRNNPAAVRLAYRHLPLWEHSGAAAAISEIAAERGQFWTFAAAMYRQPELFNRDGWLGLMSGLGFDPDEIISRVADGDDPAIARLNRDIGLADRLGITATPTFIVLIGENPPISASQRTLPGILNSPQVRSLLLEAIATPADATGAFSGHFTRSSN